jgi:hypothetical protein
MDRDDFLAALCFCLDNREMHYNVTAIWRVAEEIGRQRRSVKTAR